MHLCTLLAKAEEYTKYTSAPSWLRLKIHKMHLFTLLAKAEEYSKQINYIIIT